MLTVKDAFAKCDKENVTHEVHGKVYIVDANGTFEQHEEPSYDVLGTAPFCDGSVLFKHIRESRINRKE